MSQKRAFCDVSWHILSVFGPYRGSKAAKYDSWELPNCISKRLIKWGIRCRQCNVTRLQPIWCLTERRGPTWLDYFSYLPFSDMVEIASLGILNFVLTIGWVCLLRNVTKSFDSHRIRLLDLNEKISSEKLVLCCRMNDLLMYLGLGLCHLYSKNGRTLFVIKIAIILVS